MEESQFDFLILSLYPALGYRADEEATDPKALMEEQSKAKCVSQWYDYQVWFYLLFSSD
jgi:hypothetical protein